MTINEGMRTYRLPNPTTPEDLECCWSKLLTFHSLNGQTNPAKRGVARWPTMPAQGPIVNGTVE